MSAAEPPHRVEPGSLDDLWMQLSVDASTPSCVVDPVHAGGRYLHVNHRYAHLCGAASAAALCGQPLTTGMSAQMAGEHLATARRVLITGRAAAVQVVFEGLVFPGTARPISRRELASLVHPAAVLMWFETRPVAAGVWSRGPDPAVVALLSPDQIDIFSMLGHGLTAADIAAALGIPVEAVNLHVMAIEERLGVRGGEELARAAERAGLVWPEDAPQ